MVGREGRNDSSKVGIAVGLASRGEGRRFPLRTSEENLQRMCASQVQAFLKLVSLITQFSCHR